MSQEEKKKKSFQEVIEYGANAQPIPLRYLTRGDKGLYEAVWADCPEEYEKQQ